MADAAQPMLACCRSGKSSTSAAPRAEPARPSWCGPISSGSRHAHRPTADRPAPRGAPRRRAGRADHARPARPFEIAPGTPTQGTAFGGISREGAPDGGFYALSDDRGGLGGIPRVHTLDIAASGDGIDDVTITGVVALHRPGGTPFPADAPTVDPEGIRVAPNGNLRVSFEGNFSEDPEAPFQPFVREIMSQGAVVRGLTLPEAHLSSTARRRARDDQLLEVLSLAPDGTVHVANEGAPIPDGETSSADAGSLVRVTVLDPESGEAEAQHAHPLPAEPLPGAGGPGLTEFSALDEGAFLALERSFAPGAGNTVTTAYAEILPSTTDVLGLPALERTGMLLPALRRGADPGARRAADAGRGPRRPGAPAAAPLIAHARSTQDPEPGSQRVGTGASPR